MTAQQSMRCCITKNTRLDGKRQWRLTPTHRSLTRCRQEFIQQGRLPNSQEHLFVAGRVLLLKTRWSQTQRCPRYFRFRNATTLMASVLVIAPAYTLGLQPSKQKFSGIALLGKWGVSRANLSPPTSSKSRRLLHSVQLAKFSHS